jgi:hypothetical protein
MSAFVLNFQHSKYTRCPARFLPVCYANLNFPEIFKSFLLRRPNVVAGLPAHPDFIVYPTVR